jgi:hypothetical protein
MEKLKSHIDDLSLKYIQSLNDSTKFLLLNEEDLAGMPLEFLKVSWEDAVYTLPNVHTSMIHPISFFNEFTFRNYNVRTLDC